jgi:hypothetical protein
MAMYETAPLLSALCIVVGFIGAGGSVLASLSQQARDDESSTDKPKD